MFPLAVQALTLSREQKERGHQAYATRLLGEIARHDDPPDTANAAHYFGEAIVLAESLGMRPLLAHCHLGLGRLLRATGHPGVADAHLATARDLYAEMNMALWLRQARNDLDAGG